MTRVILDEGVPRKVARCLPGHEVTTVPAEGWAGIQNGSLLALVQKAGFEAFISNDKRIEFDQNLSRRPFAVLLLSTNHWETMKPHLYKIAAALDQSKPGEVSRVDVGRFIPRKMRKLEGP